MEKHEGKRIRLECLGMFQRNFPGDAVLQKIGAITPLDEPPLKVELQSRMGDFPGKNNVELAVTLSNTSKETLEFRTDYGIWLRVLWATDASDGDKKDDWGLPEFTRNQMSADERLHHQWLDGRFFEPRGNLESLYNMTLKPGGQTVLVLRCQLPLKGCEVRVNSRYSIKDQVKEPQLSSERWFPLTVTRFDPKSAKPPEQHFQITDIRSEVRSDSFQDKCIRLHFRIKPKGTTKVKLQHIVFEDRTLPCGQLELLAGDGSAVEANVEHYRGNASDPQDLRLSLLDAKGIETYLDIYPPLRPGIRPSVANHPVHFDQFRLQLMTEKGVEAITAKAPKEARNPKGK